MSGFALEASRTPRQGKTPITDGQELTVRGRVLTKRPAFYGQDYLMVRVSEVLGRQRQKVNFNLNVTTSRNTGVISGDLVMLRANLGGSYFQNGIKQVRGSTESSAWLIGKRAFPHFGSGFKRMTEAVDNSRDSPAKGLLAAISLGERWRVDTRVREVLRRTGTYHLLAISGVHLGAAVFPIILLSRLLPLFLLRTTPGFVKGISLALSLCTVGIYVYFSGTSTPAVRAILYFFIAGTGALLSRNTLSLVNISWCVILITCLSAVRQPDLSLLLSALAVTGIVVSGQGRNFPECWSILKNVVRITLGATLFTLPITVWLARGVSVSVLAGNALAGLFFGLFLIPCAVLLDMAALFPRFPIEPMVSLWMWAAEWALCPMEHLAKLSFSFLHLSRTGCIAASMATVAGILLWRRKGYRLFHGMVIFLLVIVLSQVTHLVSEKVHGKDLVISFPGVGQSDAAIIQFDSRTVLVDCGPPGLMGSDSPVSRALEKLGVRRIDAVFLTHLHPDHAGGLEDIVARWPVNVIYLPEPFTRTVESDNFPLGESSRGLIRFLERGYKVQISSMTYSVMGPDSANGPDPEENRLSMILRLELGKYHALFTGDAGWDQVLSALGQIRSLRLLKIPHHGSRSGFPPPTLGTFLKRLGTDGGIVMVCPSLFPGERRLPAHEVVDWFEKKGMPLLFTGKNGLKISFKDALRDAGKSTIVDINDWF